MRARVPDDITLPHSTDAEQFILGGIFAGTENAPDIYQHVAETISPESFYLDKHKHLFQAMGEVYRHGLNINALTVSQELERTGANKIVGPFIELAMDLPRIHNLDSYCQIVAEKARLRSLYTSTLDIQARILCQDDSMQIVSSAQKRFGQVEQSLPQDEEVDPEQIIHEAGGLNPFLSPESRPGIMTPWQTFNYLTNGLKPGTLTVIGAKTGIGKTSLGCQLAFHAASNGHRTHFESHEMTPDELLFRMICSEASVDSHAVRAGRVSSAERYNLTATASLFQEHKDQLVFMRKPIKTTAGLGAYLRKQQSKGKPVKLLVLDLLQKLRGVGHFERRDLEVATIAADVKALAIDFELAIVAISQLNVAAKEMYNQTPTADDFKEAKAVGEAADIAIVMRLQDAEQLYQPSRLANMYIVKHRNGPPGKIQFYFHAKYTKYEEIAEAAA